MSAITTTKQRVEELQVKVERLKSSFAESEKKTEAIGVDYVELRAELDEAKRHWDKSHREIVRLSAALAEPEVECADHEERTSRYAMDAISERQRAERAESRVAELEADAAARKEAAELMTRLGQAETRKLAAAESRIAELEAEVERLREGRDGWNEMALLWDKRRKQAEDERNKLSTKVEVYVSALNFADTEATIWYRDKTQHDHYERVDKYIDHLSTKILKEHAEDFKRRRYGPDFALLEREEVKP